MATYKFTVNGQELESKQEKLLVSDVIKIAQEKGVPLPSSKPEDLLLEVVGKDINFKLNDWVNLGEYNQFLILYDKPTPVAAQNGCRT